MRPLLLPLLLTQLKRDNGGGFHRYEIGGEEHPNCVLVGPVIMSLSTTYRLHCDSLKKSRRLITNALYLQLIYNPDPLTWEQGLAHKAVTYLVETADTFNVELRALPIPMLHLCGGGLDAVSLSKWAVRHGFTCQDGLYLIRKPKFEPCD